MPAPRLSDKRWSIDLEKRIQEAHTEDPQVYARRYAFKPESGKEFFVIDTPCLLYTSPSPRDAHESRMPSSA